MSFNQSQKALQVYLNGKALKVANLRDFKIRGTEGKTEKAQLFFANRSNGNVFLGSVQKLAFFNRALSAQELQTVFTKSTADLGSIANMVNGSDPLPKEMRYEVDENWSGLPACVAGVKAKNVKIFCADGAEMNFMISSNEEENMFFVLENAFSPALEDSENRQFESCLQHLLTVARGRCAK